ncbi:amidohydrolase [Campylobacter sp. RM9333]|uniref:amidohydrolase n=1 Tax=unclassified Campylobacter TaxID=2593542 RepID=UPI001BDB48A5|nr:amidohydrolase [Campylobacter sp. 2018MI13]MBT0883432.1 amidohydrolase [Campylobacter sp. 2018MI13]MBZ7993231.1 amidohydrolase [Campylobacter sp. RM9333]
MEVIKHYEYLHEIPELGFKEFKTSEYLKTTLKNAGFSITNIGDTGFYTELGSGSKIIGLRADIDALGHIIDDKACARHTCGHDAHMSMLLSAALRAKEQNIIKNNKIRFIFQPAEELGSGALKMIELGACEGLSSIFGMHIRPIQECPSPKAIASMYYAASSAIKINIKGKAAHGARPHLGINAIDVGVSIIDAARKIYIDPNKPSSIKATRFICDSGVTNSIPSEAILVFDLRAQYNDSMQEMKEKLEKIITNIANAYDAKVSFEYLINIPAAVINKDLAKICEKVISNTLGEENLIKEQFTPGGEDFFFYPIKLGIPSAFMGLGVDCAPGLHHPEMSLNKNALENGVKLWLNLMLELENLK